MHVVCSVGWLGAVAAFFVVAVAGLTSDDLEMVRGAYRIMELIGWFMLVPLSVASLVSGTVQSLCTSWGLIRYYWVVAKLLINVVATGVLFLYMGTLAALADLAASAHVGLDELRSTSAVLHSGIAIGLLCAATGFAVYKPPGRTRYGRRKQRELRATSAG